jgi:hypothetical protein
MRFWIVALVATIAGQAQAATEQFDLVCRGTLQANGKKPELATNRYRLDLSADQWCEKDCTTVRKFAEVAPTRILFDREDDPLKRESLLHGVNRTTGEWFFNSEYRGSIWMISGRCDAAAFSGINPQTRF